MRLCTSTIVALPAGEYGAQGGGNQAVERLIAGPEMLSESEVWVF
jgi:hypothetical protein